MPSVKEEVQKASINLREAAVKVATAQTKIKDKRLQKIIDDLNLMANLYSMKGMD